MKKRILLICFVLFTAYFSKAQTRYEAEACTAKSYGISLSTIATGIKTGNWLKFSGVDLTGKTNFTSSVAFPSPSSRKLIEVHIDSEVGPIIGKSIICKTTSYDLYSIFSCSINSAVGVKDVYLVFKDFMNPSSTADVCNIDWFELSDKMLRMQAESYGTNNGGFGNISPTGSLIMSGLSKGTWLMYPSVSLTGVNTFRAYFSTPAGGKKIEIHTDSLKGALIGTLNTEFTGGWTVYDTQLANITPTIGVKDLYLAFIEPGGQGVCNFDWFELDPANLNINTPTITSSLTVNGGVGQFFTYNIVAKKSPTSYSATGLPVGLSLDVVSGLISGTPASMGNYSVTIRAINSFTFEEKTLEINITNSVGTTRYVSQKAAIGGNGSESSPYNTIAQAIAVANDFDSIIVKQGVYRESVIIPKNGLRFVANPNSGDSVVISGCDPLFNWVNESGSIYKTTMTWDVTDKNQSNQIFSGGKMLDLCRWPANTGSVIRPTNAYADAVVLDGTTNIAIQDQDFQETTGKWNGAKIWINLSRTKPTINTGWDGQGWTGTVISTEPGKITLAKGSFVIGDAPYGLGPNLEYYLYDPSQTVVDTKGGVSAYLQKGQWLKQGNNLYVSLPNGAVPAANEAEANKVEAKKRIEGFASNEKSYLYIKGFKLFACNINTDYLNSYGQNSLVANCSNILIDGIDAKYVTHFIDQSGNAQSQWANRSGLILAGSDIVFKNSKVRYSAGPGLCVTGRRNKVLNSEFIDLNYCVTNSGAISTGGEWNATKLYSVDHEIAYNNIYNTPNQAICIKVITNSDISKPGMARIHHNVIRDFMFKTHDSGAIDLVGTDGNWVRVDHNIIYNATKRASSGFYEDFGTRYIVDHNLMFNLSAPLLFNSNSELYHKSLNYVMNNSVFCDTLTTEKSIHNGFTTLSVNLNLMNNITNTDFPDSGIPFYQKNIMISSFADKSEIFNDYKNNDYTLKSSSIKAIDKGILTPFSDLIINKPDLGSYESGVEQWKAGVGNMKEEFVLTDSAFVLNFQKGVAKTFKFPVYVIPFCGFKGTVELAISDLPEGVTATLSSTTVEAGKSVDIEIVLNSSVSGGTSNFKLTATSGNLKNERYYTLTAPDVLTSIKITELTSPIYLNKFFYFKVVAYNEKGVPMLNQPTSYAWTVSGGGTIGSNGKYSATSLSNLVTVTASSNGVSGSYSFAVTNEPTGLNKIDAASIQIFPNPANKQIRLNGLLKNEDYMLRLYNNAGMLVKTIALSKSEVETKFNIDIRELTNGLYYLQMTSKSGVLTKKLMVTK